MLEKLFTWIFFSVVFSVLPLMLKAFQAYTTGEAFSWYVLTGNGELLIVSVVLSSTAIGELLSTSGRTYRVRKIIIGACCLLLTCFSSYVYAFVTGSTEEATDASRVVLLSVIFFIATVVASCAAVSVKELDLRRSANGY